MTRAWIAVGLLLLLSACMPMNTSNSANNSNTASTPTPVMFMATLSGANENPPTTSTGTSSVMLMLDEGSKKATITGSFSGVQATAAHIHGPAAKNANAGVLIPLAINGNTLTGSATLTDAQIADLKAGLWYANVHSATFPGGEIRGQLGSQ